MRHPDIDQKKRERLDRGVLLAFSKTRDSWKQRILNFMTLAEFARMIGITPSRLSGYLNQDKHLIKMELLTYMYIESEIRKLEKKS